MERIPLPTPETMDAEQLRVYKSIVTGVRGTLVGPLRAALLNPSLAEQWSAFGAKLRFGTSLTPRASELAIIITARRWNSQIEWYVHAMAAAKAGLSDAVIEEIRQGQPPHFETDDDEAIYEYTRQMLQTGLVDDVCYARVRDRWGPSGVMELTAVFGYYTLVSLTLNAHQIPMPEGATPPLSPLHGAGPAVLTELPPAAARRA